MPEKKNKKVSFTEEDAAILLQRYDATTVFTLLQELAQNPQPKIDWSELVKKSATGISNAREYQMLWRHLAYRHSLPENFEDGAEPLVDDDSDLECELEALPPVSLESASEAAACVKVMIASRTLSESAPSSSTIEAPLTINVPVCHSSRTLIESSQPSNLMQGTSIIFPVTVQRQTLPTVSTDGIETKGLVGGNMASKRKRKTWSEEEDMQLRAAVLKWGEGNWATMAKGDNFPIKRSPTQLAQRWSILRKKDGSANPGTISTSIQYSTAEQMATRHSLSLALDMPFKKLTAPGMIDPIKTSASVKNQVQIRNTTETVASSFVPLQQPTQQALLGSSDSHAKSKLADEKPVLKGNLISDQVVKSTTAASGTQIDSLSNTISQVKVAQVKNAVDTKPAVSSLTKPSISTNLPSDPKVHSNITYVSLEMCTSSIKAASPKMENSLTILFILSQQNKHVTLLADKVPLKQDVNPTKEFRVSDPSSTSKEKVQENEPPKVTTGSQVDSKPEKGRLDISQEKSMPLVKISSSEEISKDKANPAGCEEQGSVKKATENSNLDKGSQNLDQDKKINSINENSNPQPKSGIA
ncbi:telomeric repeat binding factor 2 [Spatholobus suberectus]|nr:telomeric repeat binding factor 2 [Spatholobus suberectus]